MYTSFSIENFRLFDKLRVEPLARVNLIAGQNNAGKTALLEALSLHSKPTSPELAWAMNSERGLPGIEPGEFFSDLFHEYGTSARIKFEAMGDWDHSSRTLTIHRQPRKVSDVSLAHVRAEVAQASRMIFNDELRVEMVFDYQDENGNQAEARIWMQPEIQTSGNVTKSASLQWEASDAGVNFTGSFIVTTVGRLDERQLAAAFGQAVREGHLPTVEELLRVLEPGLRSLTAVPNELGTSLIYADTGLTRITPIALMGEGVKRLLTIALVFLHARGTAILIDEIENGLHYSTLGNVWKWIHQLSRQFDVQVFATTHSYECIVAANTAFSDLGSDDLHLHRLYRRSPSEPVKAMTYTKEALDTNIEYVWELR